MNEHSFIRSIHNSLPTSLYKWKINDNFAGGVADAYYSGSKADCWIEYKYLRELPKRDSSQVKIGLSPQQRHWLHSRHNEGRYVFAVVGSPEGCVVLTGEELLIESMSKEAFISRAVDKKAISALIVSTCQHV